MPGRTGRILLRVVLVVTMTAAALVAAELLARFQFRRAQSSGRAGDFIARRAGGPSYRSNSLGFRDREVPPKSPDRYRIAVIGDSLDRKSTRLNSSHRTISYAVFCLKKKTGRDHTYLVIAGSLIPAPVPRL